MSVNVDIPKTEVIIIDGKIGRTMKFVERRPSNVSEYGPDDDKIGNIADLRSYEESDAASYVTDNTGEHLVHSPLIMSYRRIVGLNLLR